MHKIPASEITPEALFLTRRQFIAAAGVVATSALLNACAVPPAMPSPTTLPTARSTAAPNDKLTPYEVIAGYNNFYEFSLDKSAVASRAQGFKSAPWTLTVGGLVNRPRTFDLDDLAQLGFEERVYRLRCVETWSMVVPWNGFPLSELLALVEPKPQAKYVRFETLLDPAQMPGQRDASFTWPYVEGLRLDEALHDLTILATGLYGKPLPPQEGAPVRLVVPWKYGFKYCKSIVKIDLVEQMPVSFWMGGSPSEYGFYANVNPEVAHPRWSQATERRLGESGRRDTLLFNGYGDQVAALYQGMDLRREF